ncbi:CRISPR-associated endonuclease/helicase Cas3 [Marinospirillum celere]|uniref:CRISPR-associated endonuclease/helicase Cas3 n=1 Tax=Marinospirillum celere TaxID=1122252 RepID=A0A1I1FCI2_9GAMM|nr:CRISPR-associated helicase Cas3' [Marinospirillum celere]SFB97004.1 CRISPR-associated endonuclease/helicase Cas3 [Marinospirillum celere]
MVLRSKTAIKPIPVISYKDCIAKSYSTENSIVPGHSVLTHCQIVGHVARELIARYPTSLRTALFPEGSPLVAAAHDNGKVSPTFFNKIMRACSLAQFPGFNPEIEKTWGGHAGVSQLTAKQLGLPEYVPEILGQHHGFSPNLSGMRATDEVLGGLPWHQEREKLLTALKKLLEESWPQIESVAQARLLAGLTSVSDWIGSGHPFDNPQTPWSNKAGEVLNQLGFVAATYKPQLSFKELFGFSPREAQALLVEQVSSPGVYVLEAPMGLGKTEAALYAAYKVLASGQARGIYFALPTQLTSNKIFERFNEFLQGNKKKQLAGILADDCAHRSLLLHGNAWLLDTDMGEEGRPGGAWFNQSKRGLLAPFAVGTIDQALMAAMNVKHGFVRAFGLAGKVVILDEVHTYDAYTSSLLDALITLLRDLHCTVIILSATLNQERRQQLLDRPATSMDYPLITASPTNNKEEVTEVSVPPGENRHVNISLHSDDSFAVDQALLRAEQGQQVLWIENTVREAQQRYLSLAARACELGVASGLLHSRFTVDDRQRIEDKWVNLYGKAGWPDRQTQGRILVGTQVLEQSLDIDADFMVSRFAPTDMLLQRLGRLWRHSETPRCTTAKPEAWLLAPILDDAIETPQSHFGASAFVYSPYVLCRSLEVWQEITNVSLPDDIRGLIERTYATRTEQGAMSRWLQELEEGTRHRTGRNTLQQLARVALAEGGNTLPESKAQTRYSETDSYEVLMLRNIEGDPEGKMATLTLLDGRRVQLPTQNRALLTKHELRQRTGILMRQVVSVPQGDKPKAVPIDRLKRFGLHHCFFLGHPDWPEDESVLRVALVDETDALRAIDNNEIHEKHQLEYRDDLGYRVIKNQEG